MNAYRVRQILRVSFSILVMGTAHSADAGLFRAYLSMNGSDANPCTVAAPCRLLPAALAAVNDGGEVWMLDSANFNTSTVAITKSVTILAIPGALGSVVANGGHAISINTAGVKVSLRNLNVLNLSGIGHTGINMQQGAGLTLENCEIYGMTIGVDARAANSVVAIKNTVIRDTTAYGAVVLGAVKATLDGVHLLNDHVGLKVLSGASVVVSNSVIAGNSPYGIQVDSTGGTTTRLHVANSVISANGAGVAGLAPSGGNVVSITLKSNVIAGNWTGVEASNALGDATLNVVLDGNAMIGNTVAISYGLPAVVYSRGSNTMELNGTDVYGGPPLTALAAQ